MSSTAKHPLPLIPGTALVFGVSRPLGNGLVWGDGGHALLGQLNVALGLLSLPSKKIEVNKKGSLPVGSWYRLIILESWSLFTSEQLCPGRLPQKVSAVNTPVWGKNMLIPEWLSHYYEASVGPFRSLTKLPVAEATRIQKGLVQKGGVFASRRQDDYLEIRRELEAKVWQKFIQKDGKPELQRPHYMILGSCAWLLGWYKEGREIRIPVQVFDVDVVSFTYGDTFPAMRYQDGKAYRGQVYRFEELSSLIQTYGLPQEWNAAGQHGPERYIEAQVWSDKPIAGYLQKT